MNENYFLSLELSKQLAELGFDEDCFAIYDKRQLIFQPSTLGIESAIPAPTYQQAFKFFREKYAMLICIDYKLYDITGYYYAISYQASYDDDDKTIMMWQHFNNLQTINEKLMSYEEVETACVKRLIEIVKKLKP
jgi:hypothetical protein